MNLDFFQPGIFSLVAVIMFVMAATSFGYLLSLKNRTRATQQLLGFFFCVMLSAIATLLTNLGTHWSWALAPSQDAFLMLGGIFLVRFAYLYTQQARSREVRWSTWITTAVAGFALGYSIWFGLRYLSSLPIEIDENDLYYVLTPLVMLGVIGVFFRRSVKVSRKLEASNDAGNISGFQLLLRPTSIPASALRNLGLALSIGLIPAITLLIKFSLPTLISSFIFNFGVVAAISAIMLVYLNYSQELTTVTVKLVGISLVTILLLLGFTCVSLLTLIPTLETSRIVTIFIAIVLGGSILILTVFPVFFKVTLFEPLSELLGAVKAVDQGDLDQQLQPRFPDEVGRITSSFNRMIDSLRTFTMQQELRADELQAEVSNRTKELERLNQQLIIENEQREKASERLDQQLRFEQALAGCSQILLSMEGEGQDRRRILTKALDVLRQAAAASRAYVFRRYEDADGIARIMLFAETCASGVSPHIDVPANQRFPLSDLPQDFISTLESGNPIIGPTTKVFADHALSEIFLQQDPPLFSLLLFPLHFDGYWWGFIGFDDCVDAREWGESEVTFLRTASEMIRGAIQRWEIRNQLVDTLTDLEQRVEERTQSLNDTNIYLQEEILTRQKFQAGLERRLSTERLLAKASARLVEAQDISSVLEDVLADLGEMMMAGSMTLAIVEDPGSDDDSPQICSWHLPGGKSVDLPIMRMLLERSGWINAQIKSGQHLMISKQNSLPPEAETLQEALTEASLHSLILWPLGPSNEVIGLLIASGSALEEGERVYNLQSLEVFIRLLSGLLERDRFLHTLELRVTEQTRELSTMYEMTMLASSSREIADILSPALSRIQEISKSEAACIHLYRQEQEALELISHRGLSPEAISGLMQIPIEERFIAWLERPEPDHTLYQSLPASIPDSFCFPDFQSMSISKLRAGGTTQGVVSCYRVSAEPFTPFQTSMLTVIGELLGVAVENHYLAQETEKLATVHERQRLARELHDAVSQSIYSISLFARSAKDAREVGDDPKLGDSLEQLEENSIDALREMRLLLYQLRSIALEEADLQQAVGTRMEMVECRLGIEAVLDFDNQITLDAELEQELFRIITEALNNSLHHANASRVAVTLCQEDGQLKLAIEDDGVGFDRAQLQEGMGLHNIRERLIAYKGKFEIESHPGRGTRLEISIPEHAVA